MSSRATELAFHTLASEIRSFRDVNYLDTTKFLIVFAENEPNRTGEFETQLRVFPSEEAVEEAAATRSVESTLVDAEHLMALIRYPRPLATTAVKHLQRLAEGPAVKTTLFNILDSPRAGPPVKALFDLFSSAEDSRTIRDLVRTRADAFKTQKGTVWTEFTASLVGKPPAETDPSKRNRLDDLLFDHPDVVALTLPLLGSPVIACYLGILEEAYLHSGEIIPDLYTKRLEPLRSAVVPHFLSRLTELATSFLPTDSELERRTPAQRTADFLFRAAGILLAKCATVPLPGAEGEVTVQQSELSEWFPLSDTLTVPLPWGSGLCARIELPIYNSISPSWDRHLLGEWRNLPHSRMDHVDEVLSCELMGTKHHQQQKDMVSELLRNLASLIYSFGSERKRLDDRQRRMSSAVDSLRKFQRQNTEELNLIQSLLDIDIRKKMAAFVDAVAQVFQEHAPAALVNDWVSIVGEQFRPANNKEDLGHFIGAFEHSGREANAEKEMAELSARLCDVIATRALNLAAPKAEFADDERRVAIRLIELLASTRFPGPGIAMHAGAKSILNWFESRANRNRPYIDAVFDGSNAPEALADLKRFAECTSDARLCLVGSKAQPTWLADVKVGPGVPKLLIALCLGLVGAWAGSPGEDVQSVTISAAAADDVLTLSLAVTENPDRSRGLAGIKTFKTLLDEAYGQIDSLTVDKFESCVYLLNAVFKIQDSDQSVTPDGFTIRLKR